MANLRSLVATSALAGVLFSRSSARADTDLHPLSGIGDNTIDAFVGWSTVFHVAAIGATGVLVHSGADETTTNYFRDHPSWVTRASGE